MIHARLSFAAATAACLMILAHAASAQQLGEADLKQLFAAKRGFTMTTKSGATSDWVFSPDGFLHSSNAEHTIGEDGHWEIRSNALCLKMPHFGSDAPCLTLSYSAPGVYAYAGTGGSSGVLKSN